MESVLDILRDSTIIHCGNIDEAHELLRIVEDDGYLWAGECPVDHLGSYDTYKSNTCYRLGIKDMSKNISYGSRRFYESNGCIVIEFSEWCGDDGDIEEPFGLENLFS